MIIEVNNFEAKILKSSILSKQKKHSKSIILLKSILKDYENKKELFYQIAIEYLFSLEKWPTNHPVLTGSIFLVAEFIKFANKEKY